MWDATNDPMNKVITLQVAYPPCKRKRDGTGKTFKLNQTWTRDRNKRGDQERCKCTEYGAVCSKCKSKACK